MAQINVRGEIKEAVEGVCRMKIWPPEAAEKIAEAVNRRMAVTATEITLAYASKGGKFTAKNGRRRKRTSKEVRERWQLGSAWDLPKGSEGW